MDCHTSLRRRGSRIVGGALLFFSAAYFLASSLEGGGNSALRLPADGPHRALARAGVKGARNLAVFNAVGRPSVLPGVLFNINNHFRHDPDWACIVLMYVGEEVIPSSDETFREVDAACPVVRIPKMRWGNWLQIIHPNLVGHYDKIAILLDDIFIPMNGASRVDVRSLVQQMDEHDLSSISPSISGAQYLSTNSIGPLNQQLKGCTAEVDAIETFFQIFTAEAWECYYGMLDYRNSRGWCYGRCMLKKCGGRLAVDYRMVVYHLERTDEIPEGALEGTGELFHSEATRNPSHADSNMTASAFDPNWHSLEICRKYDCPVRGNWQKPIKCDRNDAKDDK